jgi:hypothetical protein
MNDIDHKSIGERRVNWATNESAQIYADFLNPEP